MKLETRELTVTYGSGASALRAVSEVSLGLPPGKTLGIVGESGCGKSTLARALVGLVPVRGGSILLDGEDYTAPAKRRSRTFRKRVQMIFQDPYASLDPRMTVGQMLTEILATHHITARPQRRTEAARILGLVGLSQGDLEKYPHQFSGGQRQRIAIARALCLRPEVMINDEVTSALDVSAQATVLNLLKELQQEMQLSYVFISHDLSVIRYMSDLIAVMYLGQVVEVAPTEELFGNPRHPYTQALRASVPQLDAPRGAAPLTGDLPNPRRPPTGCRFHTRCPVGPLVDPSRSICREVDPQVTAGSHAHRAACHFATVDANGAADAALAADAQAAGSLRTTG